MEKYWWHFQCLACLYFYLISEKKNLIYFLNLRQWGGIVGIKKVQPKMEVTPPSEWQKEKLFTVESPQDHNYIVVYVSSSG